MSTSGEIIGEEHLCCQTGQCCHYYDVEEEQEVAEL